jgi:uncharacterized membrane protein YhdT
MYIIHKPTLLIQQWLRVLNITYSVVYLLQWLIIAFTEDVLAGITELLPRGAV